MAAFLIFFLVLLCCSAFFSASETVLFSLSEVELHGFRKSQGHAARKLVSCLRAPREILVTILFGNELINVSMSIVGAAIINRVFELRVEHDTLVAVAVITPIIFVCGDIVPKNIAIRFARPLAPVVIWPLYFFFRLITPARVVLTWIADRMVRLFGGNPERDEPMMMEKEYLRLVDLGRKEGAIVEEERELIHKVFEFTDKVAEDIMTPSASVFDLSLDLPYEQMVSELRRAQFSRIPIYDGERSNVIGILHVRDLFGFHRRHVAGEGRSLKDILYPPLFVGPKTPLESLLQEFQRTQLHMAIVKGEGEKVLGVVTMGDVLKELFGEMRK